MQIVFFFKLKFYLLLKKTERKKQEKTKSFNHKSMVEWNRTHNET